MQESLNDPGMIPNRRRLIKGWYLAANFEQTGRSARGLAATTERRRWGFVTSLGNQGPHVLKPRRQYIGANRGADYLASCNQCPESSALFAMTSLHPELCVSFWPFKWSGCYLTVLGPLKHVSPYIIIQMFCLHASCAFPHGLGALYTVLSSTGGYADADIIWSPPPPTPPPHPPYLTRAAPRPRIMFIKDLIQRPRFHHPISCNPDIPLPTEQLSSQHRYHYSPAPFCLRPSLLSPECSGHHGLPRLSAPCSGGVRTSKSHWSPCRQGYWPPKGTDGTDQYCPWFSPLVS